MRIQNINEGWKFYKGVDDISNLSETSFVGVNLPHTWNNLDGQDGGNDYFRGTSIYTKIVDLDKRDDKDYYLEFRGVNSVAYVYVNNVLACSHEGGYSTFRTCVTELLDTGENTISVAVSNSPNDSVYPEMADFTFFGGIYRDVNFIEVAKSRFDLDYYGSDGVMVTPIIKNPSSASVTVESFLTNVSEAMRIEVDICFLGEKILTGSALATAPKIKFEIASPHLWNGVGDAPLYHAKVRLVENGNILDERDIAFGIRFFAVDKDGFYLNGTKYPLHGVSRHQDRLNKGWAITRADHDEDMALIREVGATSIRLAHYQHDQYFYDLCDREGMVVWAEIPYISLHLKNGDNNAISQMRELVIQNYNHPSIMFWGLSNEITIGGESEEQLELHKRLNELVKSLDSTRLTTMANVTMCDTESPLLKVPDIFAYNHYFGWYIGDVEENATWLDEFRERYPNTPIAISEYGAEGILSWHSSEPKQGDYTEEYQAYYHENMARILGDRQYLWATYVWNMFDFGVDSRDEGGVKGRNNKGLVTYDRKIKKDSFYLYKAYWSDEPFVHICSKRYDVRNEKTTKIKVYSNQNKVDLYVGDKLVASKTGAYVFEFLVNLSLLGTKIKVTANGVSDEATFRRCLFATDKFTMKEEHSITNWFEADGKRYEFEYPDGKFSIRDKFGEIYSTEAGKIVLDNMMKEAFKSMSQDGDSEKFIKGAIRMMGGMTIERIASLAGKKMSPEMLYRLNVELNKIDKKRENN